MSSQAVSHLKKDPDFYPIIKKVGTFQIRLIRNRYESLVEAIITQQLAGSAAKAISKRFKAIYSQRYPKPIDVIKTPLPQLRKTGLSKMKITYIKDLSKKIESKEIRLNSLAKLSDEDVISNLTQVKGIGRWTAEMFLIFSLGRLDVLPVGDLGLKKGVQKLFLMTDLPSEDQVRRIGERWKPYRTVATWYLWKSLQKFDAIG